MLKTFAFVIFPLLINFLPLSASAGGWELDRPASMAAYEDETLFVRAPAKVGYIIGGTAGLIVGIPAGLVTGAVVVAPIDGLLQGFVLAPIVIGVISARISGEIGATVVGAPFYILQKTFYDLPRSLTEPDEEEAPLVEMGSKSYQQRNKLRNAK